MVITTPPIYRVLIGLIVLVIGVVTASGGFMFIPVLVGASLILSGGIQMAVQKKAAERRGPTLR